MTDLSAYQRGTLFGAIPCLAQFYFKEEHYD